jgi:hypothetical protein
MALKCYTNVAKLAKFVKIILTIIVNQAGCEQTFSDLKVKQIQHRNWLGPLKLEKMTKVNI